MPETRRRPAPRAQLRTQGTQHIPGINARVVTVTQSICGRNCHRTQADGVDVRVVTVVTTWKGLAGAWCCWPRSSRQVAHGHAFAQIAIRIKALVPIIPEDTHHALIIPLDLHG